MKNYLDQKGQSPLSTIIVAIALLVVVGAIIFFVWRSNKNKTVTTNDTPESIRQTFKDQNSTSSTSTIPFFSGATTTSPLTSTTTSERNNSQDQAHSQP